MLLRLGLLALLLQLEKVRVVEPSRVHQLVLGLQLLFEFLQFDLVLPEQSTLIDVLVDPSLIFDLLSSGSISQSIRRF